MEAGTAIDLTIWQMVSRDFAFACRYWVAQRKLPQLTRETGKGISSNLSATLLTLSKFENRLDCSFFSTILLYSQRMEMKCVGSIVDA